MKIPYLDPRLGALVVIAGLAIGCQRSDKPSTQNDTEHSTVAVPEPIPVVSKVEVAEDHQRQWLPPVESRLSSIDVSLSEIEAKVNAAREIATAALSSTDNAIITEAQQQLLQVQSAIYGLAVRMRNEWTQMEFQSFITKLNYHQLLDLNRDLTKHRADLSHDRWLWNSAQP